MRFYAGSIGLFLGIVVFGCADRGTACQGLHPGDYQEDPRFRCQTRLWDFPGEIDGVAVDKRDRVWVAELRGAVAIVTLDGTLLSKFPVGGYGATNLCFWENHLYVTVIGTHSIHRLDVTQWF